jgi:hypothetical protein
MELHVFGLVSLMVRAVVHNVGDTCDRGSLAFWVCRHSRKPWSKFINADNQHLVVPEVCKLEHFYRMKAFIVY